MAAENAYDDIILRYSTERFVLPWLTHRHTGNFQQPDEVKPDSTK